MMSVLPQIRDCPPRAPMPTITFQKHKVYYEFTNEGNGPVIVFVNGIIQRVAHWSRFAKDFQRYGIKTIAFDMPGQGDSDRPGLGYDFEDNAELIVALLDHCKVEKAYLAGISFGGTIVLKAALKYPERCAGLIPMSTFSEVDERLHYIGVSMYEGMVRVGFEYLVDWLIPINFSSKRIGSVGALMPTVKRSTANTNDLFSIQNLIESIRYVDKQGFTAELDRITCATLIMNAEYDYLTPRWCHEKIRQHIKNSRLMLIQHAFHAFTIEFPEISSRLIREFILSVENGTWKADQSVWIASDDPKSTDYAFPCEGDHTRALPFCKRPDNVPADAPEASPKIPARKAAAPVKAARKSRVSKKT
jgi:pimeloyl-ACP methyl ester carboxylesterase